MARDVSSEKPGPDSGRNLASIVALFEYEALAAFVT